MSHDPKILFSTDKQLRSEFKRKCRASGLSMAVALNSLMQAAVKDRIRLRVKACERKAKQ